MTVLTFPSNPTTGQSYAAPNNRLYIYDGEKWVVTNTEVTATYVTNFIDDTVGQLLNNAHTTNIAFTYDPVTNQLTAVASGSGGGFSDPIVFNNSSTIGSGSATLQTAAGTATVQTLDIKPAGFTGGQYLRIYPTIGEGQHIHISSGDTTNTEIYLGDDSNFVRTGFSGQGASIGTNGGDNFGGGYLWHFGNDGTLTFPSPSYTSQINGSSQGLDVYVNGSNWIFGGTGSLTLAGNNSQPAVITAASGTTISLQTGGPNYNQLYINDSGDFLIYTDAQNYGWVFGQSGITNIPGNVVPAENGNFNLGGPSTQLWNHLYVNHVNFSDGSELSSANILGNFVVYQDGNLTTLATVGSTSSQYGLYGININPGIEGSGGIIIPPNTVSDPVVIYNELGPVQVATSSSSYTWRFNLDGNLQLPTGASLGSHYYSDSSTTLYNDQGSLRLYTSYANGKIELRNKAALDQTWQFNDNGIVLPNNNVITDKNNELTVLALNTATISAGATAWWNQYGDINTNAYNTWGTSCAYDSQGNAFVVGTIQVYPNGHVTGGNAAPFFESVVVKYNKHGDMQWQQSIGDFDGNPPGNIPPFVTGESIYVDAWDNVYVLANEWDNSGSYVYKLNNRDGTLVSQEIFALGTGVFSSDLTIDNSGTVYVVGSDFYTNNTLLYSVSPDLRSINWQVELGNGVLSSFFHDYVGSGYFGIGIEGGCAIDRDSQGIYITGQTGNFNSASTSSSFTAAYDFNGNLLWQTQPFGGTGTIPTAGTSIATDGLGNVYTAGMAYTGGPAAFPIVVKHTNTGATVWESKLVDQYGVVPLDINVGSDGFIYITGESIAPNFSQLWWGKMDTNGNLLFQRFFSGEYAGTEGNISLSGHRMSKVHQDKLLMNAWTFAITTGTTSTTANLAQANMLTIQLPTDGTLAGTYGNPGSYGVYYYSDYDLYNFVNSATYTNISGGEIAPGILTTSTVNYSTSTSYLYIDNFTTTYALTDFTHVIQANEWKFDNDGVKFPDGTVQTTAYPGNAKWVTPNNGTWEITNYNGGFAGTYDGTNPLVWFDANNIPIPSQFQTPGPIGYYGPYQIQGVIVEYHAFDGNDTTIGTIWVSGRNQSYPAEATHIEHSSGNGNINSASYWNLNNLPIQLSYTDSTSRNIQVMWTARVFWGYDNYC